MAVRTDTGFNRRFWSRLWFLASLYLWDYRNLDDQGRRWCVL